ncbi:MAG: putative glycolipid-binding domain-containing protein [Thermomicrobiales bacterium]|nr:putative glycolipid-binding domain-containing protein [Thermomicrobiales bacterium]
MDDGWEVSGAADFEVNLDDMEPDASRRDLPLARIRLDYAMIMNDAWQTRTVHLQLTTRNPKKRQTCTQSVRREGIWKHKSGNMVPEFWFLEGIYQFTLDTTPAMRVQQVRAVALAVGQAQELEAVSLNLPDFSVDPVEIWLNRTAEASDEHLTTNGGLSIESHITVGHAGLVANQEGVWTRSAESGPFASSWVARRPCDSQCVTSRT